MRVPELHSLSKQKVAVFGLGCIGAPSAIEFTKAGVGELCLVDWDHVDPATIRRWPLGLRYAGLSKTNALAKFIGENFPHTRVRKRPLKVGDVWRLPGEKSQREVLASVLRDNPLVYDATTELGVQHFLADQARLLGLTYVSVSGTAGGWGGEVLRIVPGVTAGCRNCSLHWALENKLPIASEGPTESIQTHGCANPTFTASGFDMAQIALTGVRASVSAMCAISQGDAYPMQDWDVTVLNFRDAAGKALPPDAETFRLEKHPIAGAR